MDHVKNEAESMPVNGMIKIEKRVSLSTPGGSDTLLPSLTFTDISGSQVNKQAISNDASTTDLGYLPVTPIGRVYSNVYAFYSVSGVPVSFSGVYNNPTGAGTYTLSYVLEKFQ